MNNIMIFPANREPSKNALINDQIEQSLLGILLAKPERLAELPDTFDPEHYGDTNHGDIHRVIVAVSKPGQPALISVCQAMAINDKEWAGYLAGLVTVPTGFMPGYAATLANELTELYQKRRMLELSAKIHAGVFAESKDGSCSALRASVMSEMEALSELGDGNSGKASNLTTLIDSVDEALRMADAAIGSNGMAGISTGFPSLDRMLGGMEAGTLNILAGRPGSGKSSLGHQIAINVASQGIPVLEISLEMSAVQLGRRALSAVSGVPLAIIRQGQHTPYVDRLLAARKEMHSLPLSIEDGGGLTAALINLKARAAKRRHKGLGLIMIDHLHIIQADAGDAKHGGTWAVGRVSGMMKRLAKEMDCPVLLLAQLNRQVETRDDKRPSLSDLRQSGDIEQDADSVAFAYRPEMYLGGEPERAPSETQEKYSNRLTQYHGDKVRLRGKAEIIFSKVRDGEIGTVPMEFHGETTSFSEWVR